MEGRAVIAHEYMGFLGGVVAQPCEYPESHSTGHLRRVNCLVYEVYPAVWGGVAAIGGDRAAEQPGFFQRRQVGGLQARLPRGEAKVPRC